VKLIVASILVLSIIILFLFSLFPADISVSRIINISHSKHEIQKTISDLRTWKKWNVLISMPPTKDIIDTASEKSDSTFLIENNLRVQLIKIDNDTVFTKWENGNKYFLSDFTLTEVNSQVVLQWTSHFHLRWYPWEKLAGMFYDKQIGTPMEESLVNLRTMLDTSSGRN
jgi:hypothetical protein